MTNVNIKWMKSVWFRHLSWTGFVWFIACKCQWCRSTQQPLCFTLHPEGLWIALHYSDLIDFMISWKYFLWVSHAPRAHRSSVGLFERAHGIFSTVCIILLLPHRFPFYGLVADNDNQQQKDSQSNSYCPNHDDLHPPGPWQRSGSLRSRSGQSSWWRRRRWRRRYRRVCTAGAQQLAPLCSSVYAVLRERPLELRLTQEETKREQAVTKHKRPEVQHPSFTLAENLLQPWGDLKEPAACACSSSGLERRSSSPCHTYRR